jgi:Ca-activated chloride channel family protein
MRQIVVPLVLLIHFAAGAQPGVAAAGNVQDPEPYRISVDVDLVVLHATVLDRQGRFVSDLRERDFEVYQDGVRQSIRLFRHEDIPVTVGLVIDHSGSMQPKLWDVIVAARTFVRSSNREDRMFVVNFNEHVTMGLPGAEGFTNRPDELESAILKTPATGETALYDAAVAALERLRTSVQEKKVLVVIGDGGDNASAHSLSQVLKMAGQSSAVVYAIGIFDGEDADQNPGVLHRLARATGGEAFFPGQPNEVVDICERIARDIRNQYTIGFAPAGAGQPGVYRAIRVVASGTAYGKLSVRARSGYIAGGEPRPAKRETAK